MDESTAIGSCSEENEKWDIATVLGETLVAAVTDELETAVTEVLGERGADNVIDDTEVDESTAIGSCSDEEETRGNATVLDETPEATITDGTTVTADTDETEVLVTSGTAQSKYINY